jgi:hypothetical protein
MLDAAVELPPGDRVADIDRDRCWVKCIILDQHIDVRSPKRAPAKQSKQEQNFCHGWKRIFHERVVWINQSPLFDAVRIDSAHHAAETGTMRATTKPFTGVMSPRNGRFPKSVKKTRREPNPLLLPLKC